MFFWSYFFLAVNFSNNLTTLIALTVTYLTGLILKEFKCINNRFELALISIGSILQIIGMVSLNLKAFLTPIPIAIIIFYFGLYFDNKQKVLTFATLALFILIYSYTINPKLDIHLYQNEMVSIADTNEFLFMNRNGDTLNLNELTNHKVILETWNESCPSCINAFNYLQGEFTNQSNLVSVYYIYNYLYDSTKYDKVFNNKYIYSEDRVLVLLDNSMYSNRKYHGAPMFVFINDKKEVVKILTGFRQKYANEYRRMIKKFANSK